MGVMSDNRLPALLDAAFEALQAITDIGCQLANNQHSMDGHAIAYLMDRKVETGLNAEERLEKAHGKLQETLKLFTRELGIED